MRLNGWQRTLVFFGGLALFAAGLFTVAVLNTGWCCSGASIWDSIDGIGKLVAAGVAAVPFLLGAVALRLSAVADRS